MLTHPDYDITTLKTYRWAEDPVPVIGILAGAESLQLQLRVKRVTNAMLQSRGYRQVREGDVDFRVATMVGAIEQTSYSQHVVDSERYYSTQFRWTQENDYLRGAVSVVQTAPTGDDIIWQGSVGENLNNNARKAQGTIEKFMAMIGESLPQSR